jgi:phytoene dehydrogenase-like protein
VKGDISQRGFAFVDYSQIDSGLTQDSKSFGVICTLDYIDDWEKLEREEYKNRKEKIIKIFLKKLERYYPNITQLVEYAEVGTSKTVQKYIKTPNGTAYGFKPTPKTFFRTPKIKSDLVDNLYFVGQWVTAGGFSPAIVSGGVVGGIK